MHHVLERQRNIRCVNGCAFYLVYMSIAVVHYLSLVNSAAAYHFRNTSDDLKALM